MTRRMLAALALAAVLLAGCSGSAVTRRTSAPASGAAPSSLNALDAKAAYDGGFADGAMNWQRLLTPGQQPSTATGRVRLSRACQGQARIALRPDKSAAYRTSWVRGCVAAVISSFTKATA